MASRARGLTDVVLEVCAWNARVRLWHIQHNICIH